ncbi:hypothetical protein BCV70DRAFT_230662 [Testicularia cyperi]|uniref:Transcription factor BYE1 n=1 Tax=Testicularia cyperi TaxID=1882483 RepID=A0A317XSW2_9BASI|nr:hypothetical protein BCV70DRAFT_230662 [Testicularia cyperi]
MPVDVEMSSDTAKLPDIVDRSALPATPGFSDVVRAEASSAEQAGPRRGARVRKPTRKPGQAEALIQAARSSRTRPVSGSQPASGSSHPHDPKAAQSSSSSLQTNAEPSVVQNMDDEADNDDENDDGHVYCVCRGKDDGSFMISCEQCEQWFHTRCIGITQKAAKKLDEYVCQSCTESAETTVSAEAAEEEEEDTFVNPQQPATQISRPNRNYKTNRSRRNLTGKAQEQGEKKEAARASPATPASDSDDADDYVAGKEDNTSDDEHLQASGGLSSPKAPRSRLGRVSAAPNRMIKSHVPKRKESSTNDDLSSDGITKRRRVSGSNTALTTATGIDGAGASTRRVSSSASSTTARRPSESSTAASRKTKEYVDEARLGARRALSFALTNIYSQSSVPSIPKTTTSTKVTDSRAETRRNVDEMREEALFPTAEERGLDFAAELEQELFTAHADISGAYPAVGPHYKDRFRTLLFSLRDVKNTSLHGRIASVELSAAELARMTSDELANDAIRLVTEKARLEALQRSTLRSEISNAPMRKITHKGEVEIENPLSEIRDQPGKFQRSLPRSGDEPVDKNESHHPDTSDASMRPRTPPLRITASEPAVATVNVSKKVSDSGTLNDTVAMSAVSSTASTASASRRSPPTHSANSAAFSHLQSSTSQMNFGRVWTSAAPDDEGEKTAEDRAAMEENAVTHDVHQEIPADHADDFIDSFLDGVMPEETDTLESSNIGREAQLSVRSTTPTMGLSSEALHRSRQVIWNGLTDLRDDFAFRGYVKQIAGPSLSAAAQAWPIFFPNKTLLVAGRLPSRTAVDFLLQVINAARTEVVVFTMEPGQNMNGAVDANESDQASFLGMMKHFSDLDRWGVLHVSSKVRSVIVKDFYIVPLYKDQEVPVWLDVAEADCLGVDWHRQRDRNLFILVAVVMRDALKRELSTQEEVAQIATMGSSRQHQPETSSLTSDVPVVPQDWSNGPDESAYDPSAGLSLNLSSSAHSLLPISMDGTSAATAVGAESGGPAPAFVSTTLQSLLKILGKGTPQHQAASNTPLHVCPGSRSPLNGARPLVAPPRPPAPPGNPPGPPPHLLVGSLHGLADADEVGAVYAYGPYPAAPPVAGANFCVAQPPTAPAAMRKNQHGSNAGPSQPGYSGWTAEEGTAAEVLQMPEEEYPGQYNPDHLAMPSYGGRGGARGSFGAKGNPIYVFGRAGGRYGGGGRGWHGGRGRGW